MTSALVYVIFLLYFCTLFSLQKVLGPPEICNFWGERSCFEYFLLKRSFGTRTRSLPARKEANMFNPLTGYGPSAVSRQKSDKSEN